MFSEFSHTTPAPPECHCKVYAHYKHVNSHERVQTVQEGVAHLMPELRITHEISEYDLDDASPVHNHFVKDSKPVMMLFFHRLCRH